MERRVRHGVGKVGGRGSQGQRRQAGGLNTKVESEIVRMGKACRVGNRTGESSLEMLMTLLVMRLVFNDCWFFFLLSCLVDRAFVVLYCYSVLGLGR